MANSAQERLNAINPAGYPKQPELSEAAIKQNKEWVAQKRAENAAKEAGKPKTAPKKATPKAAGPSRPSFSPAVEPSKMTYRTTSPMQFTAQGRTMPSGYQTEGTGAEANRLAALAPKSVSSETDAFGNAPLPGARPTASGPGLATRGYETILKHHTQRVQQEHPGIKDPQQIRGLSELRYMEGSGGVKRVVGQLSAARAVETMGKAGNVGPTEAARTASSQMTPEGMERFYGRDKAPLPGQVSDFRMPLVKGDGKPYRDVVSAGEAATAASRATISEAYGESLRRGVESRPGERGGGRKSVDDLIAGGPASEEEGQQYEPKFDNAGRLTNPRPFDYSRSRNKKGRGGDARVETVGGERVRATGQRPSTEVTPSGETIEVPKKLRIENIGGGRRGRPDEAQTVGTPVETSQMTPAQRASVLGSDRISEIFKALGEQVPKEMRPKKTAKPKTATSGVAKGKAEFAKNQKADVQRKKIEEGAKKQAAKKKK